MAERLNPLSMIGASNDPTLGDRLTQSAKATSDLQSGLAKIAQQNRAQLEAQKMAGDTSRATALIGQGVMPQPMIKLHPDAAAWMSNKTQSELDLNESNILKNFGDAGVSATKMARWPVKLDKLGDLGPNMRLKPGLTPGELKGVSERPLTSVGTTDSGEQIIKQSFLVPKKGSLALVPEERTIKRGSKVEVKSKDDVKNQEIVDDMLDRLNNTRDPKDPTLSIMEAKNIYHPTYNPQGAYEMLKVDDYETILLRRSDNREFAIPTESLIKL
tara:strand:- start:13663 stop:14478 length:816 start_codon:yes stop_codon:yes gene_type:complete